MGINMMIPPQSPSMIFSLKCSGTKYTYEWSKWWIGGPTGWWLYIIFWGCARLGPVSRCPDTSHTYQQTSFQSPESWFPLMKEMCCSSFLADSFRPMNIWTQFYLDPSKGWWHMKIQKLWPAGDQGSTNVSELHPLGAINICTKCLGNQFNSWWDISVWTKWWTHQPEFRSSLCGLLLSRNLNNATFLLCDLIPYIQY